MYMIKNSLRKEKGYHSQSIKSEQIMTTTIVCRNTAKPHFSIDFIYGRNFVLVDLFEKYIRSHSADFPKQNKRPSRTLAKPNIE